MVPTAQGMAGSGWAWLCFQAASIVVQKKLKQPTNMALGGGGGGEGGAQLDGA
jgi:hypothetical protein